MTHGHQFYPTHTGLATSTKGRQPQPRSAHICHGMYASIYHGLQVLALFSLANVRQHQKKIVSFRQEMMSNGKHHQPRLACISRGRCASA
ncbi:hypothetical protein EJD97_024798 [Solanum chilense]|uniref:Uncharacterized protein n=1 Tax=Solanum chilense TaxID=4083 RepID=A0A6N2C3F5_SOLCI|nr:hypothetical protein EJD97_024798 [Solanum chilense]